MKKLFITLCFTIVSFLLFSQGSIPPFINYQAVIRDGNGAVLTSPGMLRFKVYDSLNASGPSYVEDHTVTPNAVGMINLKIGKGTVISNSIQGVTWSSGKVSYEVYLNGATTPISPRQQFASVPYAIYALNSGSGVGVENGTINQTLYWDGTKWKPTSNLSNDGSNVGIGIPPSLGKNKLMVVSSGSPDSSAFVSVKANAGPRDAAVRGIGSGNLSMNSNTNVPRAFSNIYGGDFFAINDGSGNAVGVSGVGASTLGIGTAFGVSGIAVGPPTSTLIGLYASVSPPTSASSINAYAAIFDKGKVSFNDDVYFPGATTATAGAVMILDPSKKGVWTNNAGFNLWSKTTLTAVELANPNDNVGIGTSNNPTEKLQIQSGGNTDLSIISPSTNISSVNFGTPSNHSLGRIAYNASGHSLNFSTNGIPNRIFINGIGNVGIGNGSPRNTLSIVGSVAVSKVGISNSYTTTPSDYIIETSATTTITLINSALVDEGTLLVIRNRSGTTITINSAPTDYIQRIGTGSTPTTTTLTLYSVLRLYKSGIGWIEM